MSNYQDKHELNVSEDNEALDEEYQKHLDSFEVWWKAENSDKDAQKAFLETLNKVPF